jgi:hypothetical protein
MDTARICLLWIMCVLLWGTCGLSAHPDCKERTTMIGLKHVRHDLKPVAEPCHCPCLRYHHIDKYGRCSHCWHFVQLPDPRGMYLSNPSQDLPKRLQAYYVMSKEL